MTESVRKRILLVEDEALLAMTEMMQLEKYGYAVRTVTTGEKAVDAVQNSSDIDLILMDINLGSGIDGTQAAEIILKDHGIPIVFLSSHTEPEIVGKTEKITSYGYVVKNSSITVLDASIKMAFRLFDANRKTSDELTERKKAEDALQESEENFRALFEKGPIGVAYHEMVYDDTGKAIDYRFLDANNSYRELTGVDPRGKCVTEAFPGIEDDPFDWIGTFGRVAKTGEQIRFEQYLQSNDRWYDCVAYQVKPDHFVAVFVEITKSKQAEEALKESVTRFHNLAALIPVGVYIVWIRTNGDMEFEYVSDRWCEIHGLRREDVMANAATVNDLVHPDDRESFVELNRDAANEAKPFTWKGRFFTGDRDQRELRIESTPVVLDNGDIRWFGVTQDITGDKQAEERYQSLFNYSNDAIFVHEIGSDIMPGRIIEVNEQACRLFQYSREELLQMSMKDIASEKNLSVMHQRAQKLIEQKHLTFEAEDVRRDGSVIPVEVSAFSYNEGGKDFVVSSVRDISDRKQTEEALFIKTMALESSNDITDRKQAEKEIQKQLSEKELLLREVHHRVKNNMANVESLLSLQAASTVNAEVKVALQDAFSRVQSMRVLYDKLLLSENLHEVSMKDYAVDLLDSLAMVFYPESNMTIEKHIADFEIDARKAFTIGIILNELLTNVFKYAFRDRENGLVSVSIEKKENEVSLIIQDNGVGFDERALANESPGFGLTIVKMLVDQLGGTYSLSNDNGARSVVRFAI